MTNFLVKLEEVAILVQVRLPEKKIGRRRDGVGTKFSEIGEQTAGQRQGDACRGKALRASDTDARAVAAQP